MCKIERGPRQRGLLLVCWCLCCWRGGMLVAADEAAVGADQPHLCLPDVSLLLSGVPRHQPLLTFNTTYILHLTKLTTTKLQSHLSGKLVATPVGPVHYFHLPSQHWLNLSDNYQNHIIVLQQRYM